MNYLDLKYVRLVSGYLTKWKEVGRDLWRFRCPFCGDSKKSDSLARGYFFNLEDKAMFKCHNCGLPLNLGQFLAEIAPALLGEYKLEKFKQKNPTFGDDKKRDEQFITTTQHRLRRTGTILAFCDRLLSLPEDHHARVYLDGRKIPESNQSKLFYIDDVRVLAKNIPGYGERAAKLPKRDAIIIPFFDEDGALMYLQCRFFDENFRYMTFQIEDEGKKIWGLDRVDWSKRVYVCEGPFDAMFLDNCVAVAGAGIMSEIEFFQSKAKAGLTLIFDKDYRTNFEVHRFMCQAVEKGHSLVLFDKEFKGKDMNDQIQKHFWTREYLKTYVDAHTYKGLSAKLELTKIRPPKNAFKSKSNSGRFGS